MLKLSFYANILILLFVMSSCKVCDCEKELKMQLGERENISVKSVNMSPKSRTFLKRLEIENNDTKTAQQFIPSETLVNDFGLKLIEKDYFIGGLIKLKDGKTSQRVKGNGVHVSTEAGNILSVLIPVDRFIIVSQLDDIEYLQINENVKLK